MDLTELADLFWQVRKETDASDPVSDHLIDPMVALHHAAPRCIPRAETMSELTALAEMVAADVDVLPAEALLAGARRGSALFQLST